ncbi:S8 family serine peptidase [Massilia sp. Dwa41.01b]|uniref:S8 family serine peptidase n=1 Tax=unclassified Massilia TaxID=2609279 RepID=UPI001604841C|nr:MULTISPECIES: S8 family serine peptidase [unclassified Massilia]QNA87901.1 S8 family serine peptidase [Massilia sp. Dwa41.01b]QNA98804.1 S8 family serine peptidase [Massilia sp. Se16.2.3]
MVQHFQHAPASLRLCLAAAAAALLCSSAHAADTTRVIVGFKPGAKMAMKSALGGAAATAARPIFGTDAVAMEVPRSAVRSLQDNPDVEFVEEDAKRYPFALATPSTGTPYATGQQVPYGVKLVQADQLSDAFAGNRKVCIIDSGFDRRHEDLIRNHVSGEYDEGTGWWYTDENNHGTHVAGTIAAVNNSGKGVVGVNPNSQLKLHIVKVFGADGWAYSSDLATAANKCKAAGANVVSMSLGGGTPTLTERRAFDGLAAASILSFAAAGNDGNTTVSYPAGYPSVVSVGALDENRQWASFSQYNSKVELAGPGVSVLSTVPMGRGLDTVLSVGATGYTSSSLTGAPIKVATAPLADFGIGDKLDPAMAGKICLIGRGSITFGLKVLNCQNSGGVGAVIYNNVPGAINGTLGEVVTTIASVSTTDTDGAALRTRLGQEATVGTKRSNYAYFNGTSMATPHVAAVAALVWSHFPTCSAAQIRASLDKSALDLGTAGRDPQYGFGLVQARAAYERIKSLGCGM